MNKSNNNKGDHADLKDSAHDQQRLKGDYGTLDLPDVKDIPGQEHIVPPAFKEFANSTISSSDEEGEYILDNSNLDDHLTEISAEERRMLDNAFDHSDPDDHRAGSLALDNRDEEGQPLNEKSIDTDRIGMDLDSPLLNDEMEEE